MAEHRGGYWDERLETLPRSELRELQLAWLQWQLRRCWDGAPFYRARLERAGLDPTVGLALDDLRRLAPLRPEELVVEQRAHPPFGRLVAARRETWRAAFPLHLRGAGTIWDLRTEADTHNLGRLAARLLWQCGVRADDTIASLFDGQRATHALLAAGADRLGALLLARPAGAPVAEPAGFAASVVARPADVAESAPGHSAPPRLQLFPWTGASVAPDVCTWFGFEEGPAGSSLALPLAAPCEQAQGLHWCEDHFLVEALDPATMQPLADSELGVIAITTLTREGTPLLRFLTGVQARLTSEPCPCGRTGVRLL